MVNVEEYEEVAVGAFSGAVGSEIVERRVPKTVDLPVLGTVKASKLVNGGAGILGIGLAAAGARNMGPLSRSGKGFFAGLGASMLGNMVTTSVFKAQATQVQVSQASPSANVQVESPQVEVESTSEEQGETLFEAEETEAATPSGETLGGI